MISAIIPKLPMRDKAITRAFYVNSLGFQEFGSQDFEAYLMLQKDHFQIHFFEFKELKISENYGQVYIRLQDIETYYQMLLDNKTKIHPNGALEVIPNMNIKQSIKTPLFFVKTRKKNIA